MSRTQYTKDLETTWTDNINAFCSTHPAFDARGRLEHLVTTAIRETHDEWEPGEACPNCTSRTVTRVAIREELTRHRNGEVGFNTGGNTVTVLLYACADCQTTLAVSPTAFVLTTGPTQDIEIPTGLRDRLADLSTTQDWEPGHACSACDSIHIVESPVDAEYYVSDNGVCHYDGSGERLETVAYSCSNCGQHLNETPAHLLADYFSL